MFGHGCVVAGVLPAEGVGVAVAAVVDAALLDAVVVGLLAA
jgi:hypothetical protein